MSLEIRERRPPLEAASVGLLLLGACFLAFPRWPDDWDGLGFLSSVRHFDLKTFAPHPPGYPVYVALLKVAAVISFDPIDAARVVAGMSAGLSFFAIFSVLADWAGSRASPWRCVLAALFVCGTPLAFHSLSGIGSEAPAMACAALALRGVSLKNSVPKQALLVGLGVGLGLGVRLSWAPFYLPFLLLTPRPARFRAFGIAALATLAWTVGLLVKTGPTTLFTLFRTHLGGHLTRWGGAATTDPVRGRFLLRDIFSDGFGGGADVLGLGILVVFFLFLAIASVLLFRAPRLSEAATAEGASITPLLARALFVTLPYLLWIAVGQNLREQPRHALPVVLALSLGIAALALSTPSPLTRHLFTLLAALVFTRSVWDAYERHEIPPPGAQLVLLVRDLPARPRWIITGQSARFFDRTPVEDRTLPASSVGEAISALMRQSNPLGVSLITSEVLDLDEANLPLAPIANLCRPPRLDHRTPCLNVYAVETKELMER